MSAPSSVRGAGLGCSAGPYSTSGAADGDRGGCCNKQVEFHSGFGREEATCLCERQVLSPVPLLGLCPAGMVVAYLKKKTEHKT